MNVVNEQLEVDKVILMIEKLNFLEDNQSGESDQKIYSHALDYLIKNKCWIENSDLVEKIVCLVEKINSDDRAILSKIGPLYQNIFNGNFSKSHGAPFESLR